MSRAERKAAITPVLVRSPSARMAALSLENNSSMLTVAYPAQVPLDRGPTDAVDASRFAL